MHWAYTTEELGRAVRRLRTAQGLTQDELAERLGVARMTVSRLERGEPVHLRTALAALAECGHAVAVVPKFSHVTVSP